MTQKDNYIMKQYLNSQVDLEEVKSVNIQEEAATKEYEKFKAKLKVLDGIQSISEEKRLVKDFLPLDKEQSYLKIGNAKCVIISRGDVFRVCLDSEKEHLIYNIIKPTKK